MAPAEAPPLPLALALISNFEALSVFHVLCSLSHYVFDPGSTDEAL